MDAETARMLSMLFGSPRSYDRDAELRMLRKSTHQLKQLLEAALLELANIEGGVKISPARSRAEAEHLPSELCMIPGPTDAMDRVTIINRTGQLCGELFEFRETCFPVRSTANQLLTSAIAQLKLLTGAVVGLRQERQQLEERLGENGRDPSLEERV